MKKLFTLLLIMLIGGWVFGQKTVYHTSNSGNWNDPTTWLGNTVPPNPLAVGDKIQLDDDITLTDSRQVDGEILFSFGKILSITTGSFVLGTSGKMNNINGSFSGTTYANFRIESDANGTGSLISNSSPDGTLECYISGNNWHLIGPPSSGQFAADYFLSGYMQTWADGDPGFWTIQEGNPALSRGFGAAYYFYSDFTADMYGSLDGDAFDVIDLGNAGGGNDGFHLLANPFPCGLDYTSAVKSSRINYWSQTYNGSSYQFNTNIGVSQGFFIQVFPGGSGDETISFPLSSKIHNNTNVKEGDKEESDLLQITLRDNAGKSNDQLTVMFNDEATFEYDLRYDAHKIIGNPVAGEMMAQITDTEFACLLGIPFPVETTTVAVNFTKGDESEYTIELERNLLDNIKVTLEDIETGFVVDLSETPVYTFTAQESKEGRFLLHFKSVTGVQELSDTDPVRIWNLRNEVYIQQDQPEAGIIYIYDISGKLVYSQDIDASGLQKIQLNGPQGAYIVKLISGNQSYSQKIIK